MTQSMIPLSQQGNLDSTNLGELEIGIEPPAIKLSKEQKQELIAWAKTTYDQMKTARSKLVRQWCLNLSMYYGKQYYELVHLANGDRRLIPPKAPKGKVRHTVNLIRPMIRSEIARMTSQKPTATAIPATTSDSDMFAAQAAEQMWEFIQQRRGYHQKMMRNAFWTTITGTGFTKVWWDAEYNKNTALLAGSLQPAVGDVLIDVVTPFNLFIPDFLEQDIENQPYVFEAYTKPVEWVKRFWPNVGDNIAANVVSKNEIIESSYFVSSNNESAKPDAVLVIECWVKPGAHKLLPNGGMFTIAADKLLQDPTDGLPYSHQEYPYAKYEHIPTGTFYGDSVLVDINLLQREYNRSRSHIIESKELMARPQLLVQEGSLDPSKLTAQPGLIIRYRQGFNPPTPLSLTPLPSYVLQEQDRIKGDMEDISGQHSVTRGSAPGAGVTAATAISFLQERDDSIMGPTYASIEAGTEKTARQALALVVDYYTLPRIIEATGLDQSFDSLELKGSDIIHGKNIRVEGGSALPTSKAAKQALLMDMAKMGFISGDQMLDMLDIGGIGKITERLRIDLRQAQRENLKMKKLLPEQIQEYEMQLMLTDEPELDPNTGYPTYDPMNPASYPPMIQVNDYDNHQVHITAHNDYRKSQEFEMLDDVVKDQFSRHVEMHQKALMFAMMSGGMVVPPGSFGQDTGQPTVGGMPMEEEQVSDEEVGTEMEEGMMSSE